MIISGGDIARSRSGAIVTSPTSAAVARATKTRGIDARRQANEIVRTIVATRPPRVPVATSPSISQPVQTPGPAPAIIPAPTGGQDVIISGGNGGANAGLKGILGGIAGAAVGFATGGPGGAVAGAVSGYNALEGGSEPPQGSPTIPGNVGSSFAPVGGGGSGGCPAGTTSILGQCLDLQRGGATQGAGLVVSGGESVRGGMGLAFAPTQYSTSRRACGRGYVLGRDGLCYDKRTISNRDRMWPKGRKPLLTGGEMNAITKAARAARRVKGTQKKLQKLGLLPKPKTSRGRGSRGVITKSEAARALRS